MNTTTTDLTDLLANAGINWTPSRGGFPTIAVNDEYMIRTWEEDGTFFLSVLTTSGLIHTEMRFSGIAAQVCLLSAIDAVRADFA